MPPQQPPQQYQQYPPPQYSPPPKKKRNTMLIVGAVAVVAILLIASLAVLFWPGGEDDDDDNAIHNIVPKILDTGAFVDAVSGTIGSMGGAISINDASNLLDGLRIEVPQGALEFPVDFDISSAVVTDADGLPDTGEIVSRMISIDTDGTDDWNIFKMFDQVLTVTLPYDGSLVTDEEGVPGPYPRMWPQIL